MRTHPFCLNPPPPVSAAETEDHFGYLPVVLEGLPVSILIHGRPLLSWGLPDFFRSVRLWCWVCCPTAWVVLAFLLDQGTESSVRGSSQLLLPLNQNGTHRARCWAVLPFPAHLSYTEPCAQELCQWRVTFNWSSLTLLKRARWGGSERNRMVLGKNPPPHTHKHTSLWGSPSEVERNPTGMDVKRSTCK